MYSKPIFSFIVIQPSRSLGARWLNRLLKEYTYLYRYLYILLNGWSIHPSIVHAHCPVGEDDLKQKRENFVMWETYDKKRSVGKQGVFPAAFSLLYFTYKFNTHQIIESLLWSQLLWRCASWLLWHVHFCKTTLIKRDFFLQTTDSRIRYVVIPYPSTHYYSQRTDVVLR